MHINILYIYNYAYKKKKKNLSNIKTKREMNQNPTAKLVKRGAKAEMVSSQMGLPKTLHSNLLLQIQQQLQQHQCHLPWR